MPIAVPLLLVLIGRAADGSNEVADVVFGRDVRPVLSDRCFQCHGPDAAQRKADLRLDVDAASADPRRGDAVIVPGDPEASALWQRITSDDPDAAMPPPSAGKRPLSDEEKAAIHAWIASGARYQKHWAFVPPTLPLRPEREANVVDDFVHARLDRAGIEPSPSADVDTLARRLFLDLTGLPPTPEELAAFAAAADRDGFDAAWTTLIDRLFDEDPYRTRTAEHMTVPWLDAARYADTCGIHMDNGRQMWLWRDWVIDAFRRNLPYDEFVVDQLAGDLLPDATTEDRVASGFNRNHVTTDEGGAIAEEYLLEYAVDRVNTTSTVFLGLSMGCARCHDHKYDPFTMEDYYGLIAYFNSIDEPGLYTQTQDVERAYEPFMTVPTPAQSARRAELTAALDETVARLAQPLPGETESFETFMAAARSGTGTAWSVPTVVAAASSDPAVTLDREPDGAIIARGPMPDGEDYVVELRTSAPDLRLLMLEARSNPEGTNRGPGRAPHGNAVVTHVHLEQEQDDGTWRTVPLGWAWADRMQMNGNFPALNVLDDGADGWAMDSFGNGTPRTLLLLAEEPFGTLTPDGDARLRITVAFRSVYPQHSLAHLRFQVSPLAEGGADRLPVSNSRWFATPTFRAPQGGDDFDTAFGPEARADFDPGDAFGAEARGWAFDASFVDGAVVNLGSALGARYVGRTVVAPTARELTVSLGSDDAFRLFVNGVEVAANRVNRPPAPDQDRAAIPLRAGRNSVVFKIVNTGGPTAYYYRAVEDMAEVLPGALLFAIVPEGARAPEQTADFRATWRRTTFPGFRAVEAERDRLDGAIAELDASVARTMVMRERAERRPTFVMDRGQYDHPDESRPVERAVPRALGALPEGAPTNRLGLARWIVKSDNPLTARVAVNRVWAQFFGRGLVETIEDFGRQGSWPTHPELLDWLAVDFARDWDVQRLVRRIVSSETYRQESRVRPEAATIDAGNTLLWRYPARRLSAEQVRDLALYASGLLVEEAGGPSVRPYQPDGLWREIAMLNSNTRTFQRDDGDALWRRTMYTYWKRASPPPSLMTFDAPTRESCVVRRGITNTPLQALVLWNDVQFVEAARVLADRVLAETDGDDAALRDLFLRCTGRPPDTTDLEQLRGALAAFRARYAEEPADADALLAIGEAPTPMDDAPEHAAWTMIASAVLSLHETITQD